MGKFVMRGGHPLVIFFEDKLRVFNPGEVIEANLAPHSWFREVVTSKPKEKVIFNQPVVTKRQPKPSKSKPRIDFKE